MGLMADNSLAEVRQRAANTPLMITWPKEAEKRRKAREAENMRLVERYANSRFTRAMKGDPSLGKLARIELEKARAAYEKRVREQTKSPLRITYPAWDQKQKEAAAARREAKRKARSVTKPSGSRAARPVRATCRAPPRRAQAVSSRKQKRAPRRETQTGPKQCTCKPQPESGWCLPWCCSSAVQEKCEFCQRNKPEKRTRGEKKRKRRL